MKPMTADNNDGRVLLALRAGEMTPGELSERGLYFPGWFIKAGYVVYSGSSYRMTEVGRAACPFRNPLAAPGIVPPATYKPEIDMSRQNIVTRQQVLAAVKDAGEAGIRKQDLCAQFEHLVHEEAITSHLVMLKKDGSVSNPSRGTWVALDKTAVVEPVPTTFRHPSRVAIMEYLGTVDAPRMAVTIAQDLGFSIEGTQEVLHGLYSDLKIERVNGERGYQYTLRPMPKAVVIVTDEQITHLVENLEPEPEATAPLMAEMQERATTEETIEIKGIPDRRGPITMMHPDETEIGIFSSGRIEITDEFNSVLLTEGVVRKLRGFLGLFSEVA